MSRNFNPCLSCGACCAFYRASFYWAECEDVTPNGVPLEMTKKLNDFMVVMKGTESIPPRCIALEGVIGEEVRCTIYERRPAVCRIYIPSWEDGNRNVRCDEARLSWGLKPIEPDSWVDPKPDGVDKAA